MCINMIGEVNTAIITNSAWRVHLCASYCPKNTPARWWIVPV